GVDAEDPESLKRVSGEIRALVMNGKMPADIEKAIKDAYEVLSVGKEVKNLGGPALDMVKAGRDTFVAVRSSGTAEDLAEASFAGQMKTLLNVQGMKDLLEAIKDCWASLYTPRAIFYRKTQGIGDTLSIGVIVQRMINSDKSGVIFTVDPTTNDPSKIVVEAAWGLGESVVSGLVTPDVFILDKQTGEIAEKKVMNKKTYRTRDEATGKTIELKTPPERADKQVLDEAELRKLWELSKRVEDHYRGQAQDIEWCEERSRMFFVQTRPVTTLGKAVPEEEAAPVGEVLLEGLGASPGVARGSVKIIHSLGELGKMEKGNILVARMTNPDMVTYMKIASAIVTDEGGLTSHAAIVSRELGLPCVVGTREATTKLQEDQEITVDATRGKIYSGEVEVKPEAPEGMPEAGEVPAALSEGFTATEIKVNIAFPETAERVADRADGVGLLRAEHMLTESGKHPVYLAKSNPEELVNIIMEGVGKIAKAFYPKPVWYRTLDARTDEFRSLEGGAEEPQEANPMLGWHGVRRALDEPDVFKCEVEAIKRLHEQGLNNVAIMLPFIAKVEELRKAKEFITFPVKLGIMVETPAAALEIEAFCQEGIDFASIGSNDLTQMVLGVDRGNAQIAKLYSELDPAVLDLIKHTVQVCRKYKVPSSICGEAGSNPEMAEKLVGFGISSISCEMDAIDKIRLVVAKAERKLLLDKIRNR
ncbi:MAG: phosphoenolpyruvate synthase, partial [Candidatus Aenigmatarchaeota archaeon]